MTITRIRLDKQVSKALGISRKEAKKLISSGQVTVVGEINKDSGRIIKDWEKVEFSGKRLTKHAHRYIMLNKPAGYLCSTKDEQFPSALNLLDLNKHSNLHFAGRLDVDTTGLVLISDDGQWTHRIASPRREHIKTYRVSLDSELDDLDIKRLEKGIILKNESKMTKPASVKTLSPMCIELSICEGKYHQVKRMIAAVGHHVTKLHRCAIAHVTITAQLPLGHWRYLTESEIKQF